MIRNLQNRILRLIRRIIGTEQVLRQQSQQLNEQQQLYLLLVSLGSGLKYLLTDSEQVKASTTYNRCLEIVSLLTPMDVLGGKYVRVGRNYDGGYIMLDDFQIDKVEAAYSFGISSDISWDEGIANRGIDVYMYDHMIDQLPKNHPKFHYFREGVTGVEKGESLKTLGELIAKNGHTTCTKMVMKMDIEGREWDVFRESSSSVISQFYQIVVELHGLSPSIYDSKYASVVNVLKKLNQTHQSIHVHANGWGGVPLWIGELVLPSVLEVTYVRRNDVKDRLLPNTRQFPTEIDQPSSADYPDLYLGSFAKEKRQSVLRP